MLPAHSRMLRLTRMDDPLASCTDRLHHRYLLFMWHVFGDAFFWEIHKLEKAKANRRRAKRPGKHSQDRSQARQNF